jgi:hypothetical protein
MIVQIGLIKDGFWWSNLWVSNWIFERSKNNFFSGRKDYLIGLKRVENLPLSGFTKDLSL